MDRTTAVTPKIANRCSAHIKGAVEGTETEFSYPPPPSPKAKDDRFEDLRTSFIQLASRTSTNSCNKFWKTLK